MTRRYRRAATALATVLTLLLGLLSATSPAGAALWGRPAPKDLPPNCGQTVYKADGSKWVCTFDDEFSGMSLDSSKWTAWDGVNYFAATEPNVCYYDDPQHVAVRFGVLRLSVTRLASGATCQTPYGTGTPTYGAGVINTKDKFSQTTGRFAARIKFAGGVGLHNDFWLYPSSNDYPGKAEIDIAEPWGALPNTVTAATHVTGPDGADDGAWQNCAMRNWASGFHTYQVDWTTSSITFTYDGKPCYTFAQWTPMTGYSSPAPFNQNFFMILQVLVDAGVAAPAPNATTRFPATMQVDWVRVWK